MSAGLLVLATAVLSTRAGIGGTDPLQTIELKTYDWRLSQTARPETARTDIALVAIDEGSLRTLEPFAGRWPWPRVVHSTLIDFLARAGAKLIAYDIDFAEADSRIGLQLRRLDLVGRGIRQGLRGFDQGRGQRDPARRCIVRCGYVGNRRGFRRPISRSTCPASSIAAACCRLSPGLRRARPRSATICFILDPDGPLRHVVPFVRSHRARAAVARRRGGAACGRHRARGGAARRQQAALPRPRDAIVVAPRALLGRHPQLSLGTDRLPRAGAARRPEAPHVSDLLVLRRAAVGGAVWTRR